MVAGLVNVSGFLYIGQLTTNVTGHFALFMNDILNVHFKLGVIYLVYILSFLGGSFFSGLIMDWKRNLGLENILIVPIIIESVILIGLPFLIYLQLGLSDHMIAFILLFAMGMQNAYVTRVSGAIVRTTHLTGLFTDLGIELSQLLYPELYANRQKIKAMIRLRLRIILSFFVGGIVGGLAYSKFEMGINTTILGGLGLIVSLVYDILSFRNAKAKAEDK